MSAGRIGMAPSAVVIGAGLGGLAAAIRLTARGYRVTVLERLDRAGGRCGRVVVDGYAFDLGAGILAVPHLLRELWRCAGRRLEDDVALVALDPFYEVRFADGEVFRYAADVDALREEVRRFAPGDVDGFDRFMTKSAELYRVAFAEMAHLPFDRLGLLLRSAPDVVRLGGYRSVYTEVARHFADARLRVVFSFHPLLLGGNPFATTAYYCLANHLERLHGVHFPRGGMGALVAALVRLIEHQGGAVRLAADVARIRVDGGRATGVELSSGERIDADIVVSDVDAATTYGELLADVPRRRWNDARLARAAFSPGLFVWHFGTDRRYAEVAQHTMLIGDDYRAPLDMVFAGGRVATDAFVYVHRPTATDPSLAPTGGDVFYAMLPVPNLAASIDWPSTREDVRTVLAARLERDLLPGLSEATTVSHLETPADARADYHAWAGAGFAMAPSLFQTAWFRPHNRSEEVDRLYLVGAGTHPSAGVPGVLSSARILDQIVPAPAALS